MSFTMFDHSLSIPQDVVFTIPNNTTIVEEQHCEMDKPCEMDKCDNLLICKEDQLCCEIECQIDCFVEELQSIKFKLRNMHEKHRRVDSQLTTCMAKCSDLTVENAGLRDQLNRTTLNYDDSQNLLSKLQETNKNQSENLKQLKTEKLVLETFCKKTYTELTTLI